MTMVYEDTSCVLVNQITYKKNEKNVVFFFFFENLKMHKVLFEG